MRVVIDDEGDQLLQEKMVELRRERRDELGAVLFFVSGEASCRPDLNHVRMFHVASGRVRELPGMGSAPANRGHRARVLYPPHVREKTLGLGAFLRGIGAGKSPRARDKTRRAPQNKSKITCTARRRAPF